MKLVDRYVYAVMEHLPADIREDIGKELRANIEDMLSDDYTEEEAYQVLNKLGSPWKLANEYNPNKKYVIGPGYYEKYISTLKMVLGICILVSLSIALFVWMIEKQDNWYQHIVGLFSNLISAGFSGAFQGIFWVTLVFVIMERSGVEAGQIPLFNKAWTPEDLPDYPMDDKLKISRGETVFSMFTTILFAALFYFRPQLIALYLRGENGNINIAPIFNIERLKLYITIILVMTLLQLCMFTWKYITERWSLPLATMNAIYNSASCILVVVMLSDKSLFNPKISLIFTEILNTTNINVASWLEISKLIFIFFFIGICVWDSSTPLTRCLKAKYRPTKMR